MKIAKVDVQLEYSEKQRFVRRIASIVKGECIQETETRRGNAITSWTANSFKMSFAKPEAYFGVVRLVPYV